MYHVPLSLRIAILWSGGTFDSDLATKCHGMLIPGRSKSVDVEEARILQTDQEQDKCAICFNTEEGKIGRMVGMWTPDSRGMHPR
ncbi:hypothetical protein KEM48_007829 [Puccinia striiformis f. sp. tritici PST-130]|nr:hypothetical protein KEM48_007829 [Puccinia striiformis f. sp. tritici PST-130]